MKTSILCLLCFAAALPCAFGSPADADFSTVSNAVIELLRSEDATRFAKALAASADDWKAVASTNVLAKEENPDKVIQGMVDQQHEKVQSSARELIARAHLLDLHFTNGNLNLRLLPPDRLSTVHYPRLQADGQDLPWTQKIEITLAPDSQTNHSSQDEFKLVVRGLIKFPAGWRSYGGIQWETIPTTAGGQKMAQETALLNKAAQHQGFTAADDPALLKLGDVLIRFIRERDPAIYEKEALINSDMAWGILQSLGRPDSPPRKEVDDEINRRVKEQMASARLVLQQLDNSGIDLKNADIRIQDASLERSQAMRSALAPASMQGLTGEQFKLKLEVKSTGKAKNGTPLSGVYVLAAASLQRFDGEWKVEQDLHWTQLPDGVVDAETAAAVNQETYVGEHGTLPPQTAAPEIEFTTLEGEKKMKLSDLRGKVVVLDFWATWCGPCQEPMAHLQTLRQEHPDWKDRVAIVPLSIDDTIKQVRQHVEKRGWTNTFNVWAGDGGWHSTPTQTFRVTGVPTTYIIDADGKIVEAGHPAGLNIGGDVDRLLNTGDDRLLKTPAK